MKGLRFFGTIQVKLIIIYLLMMLFAMQLIGAYFTNTMESSFMRNFSDQMNKQAFLLAEYVEPYLANGTAAGQENKTADGKKSYSDLNEFVSNWYKINKADIQIMDANGVVIATSQANAQTILGQKNTQTIVSRALQNIKDKDNERNIIDTDGKRKKMMAKPVGSGGKVVGAVYVVASMDEMYDTIHRINQIFFSGTIIALGLTAVLGVILSHTITNPIKEITKQATVVAEGNFERPLQVRGHDEIGQLSSAFNHMTDRLKEALSMNEEEREKLESVLANMSEGVLAVDDANRIVLINRRAKQMLQLKEKDAIGEDLFTMLGLSQDTGKAVEMAGENTELSTVLMPDDEEELKVRVTFTPIHRREKGVVGTIVVLQDVTEQEKMEHARREFVANVSHELRTPLTTIKSYLEALEDGALDEPPLAYRFVSVTRNETDRMIRLVSDLLNLSRFDSKQAAVKMASTDVTDMLDEVADRFSFQLQQRNIRIDIRVDDGLDPILLDRDKISQVLDNLVSNSIKYTADGGRIAVSACRTSGSQLEVSVEDNGIGIPKKDLARIFERFYRVDKARSRNMGGTGLGLSIAREIVKAHGGSITIDSEYNHGTKVTFMLPYRMEGSEAG